VLTLRFLARLHEHACFMQEVIGLYQWVNGMTAVHTSPALHRHESLGSLKIEKLVFYHQALTTCAVHDSTSLSVGDVLEQG
jgi:hypothetical protein